MYKQIDHNTQVKYIESFIIDKNPVIKKPKSNKDKYYLLDCPKCSKKSVIYLSQSKDNYIFKCLSEGLCDHNRRGITIHTLLKKYGGYGVFKNWCREVFGNRLPLHGKNDYGMYRIKKEIREKTFKEKMDKLQDTFLGCYYPEWKKRHTEF